MDTYEFRDGINRIKVELTSSEVLLSHSSLDSSLRRSELFENLSPQYDLVIQRCPTMQSCVVVIGAVVSGAILAINQMLAYELSYFVSSLAAGSFVLSLIFSYFIVPKRKYVIFKLKNGVQSFVLKSNSDTKLFDAMVSAIQERIISESNNSKKVSSTP